MQQRQQQQPASPTRRPCKRVQPSSSCGDDSRMPWVCGCEEKREWDSEASPAGMIKVACSSWNPRCPTRPRIPRQERSARSTHAMVIDVMVLDALGGCRCLGLSSRYHPSVDKTGLACRLETPEQSRRTLRLHLARCGRCTENHDKSRVPSRTHHSALSLSLSLSLSRV